MMYSQTITGDLPTINLTTEEIKDLMCEIFSSAGETHSFQFFVSRFSGYLLSNKIGFKYEPNTTYHGSIHYGDQARLREIIWDMIIDRYLTIGGNGHDEWPNFTVTERGRSYFQSRQTEQ